MSVHAVVAAPSRELNRFAVTRQRHHRDVIAVDVPPVARAGYADVADALLCGLGKDPDLTHAKRSAEPLAAAWLALREVRHALVVDAQLLPVPALDTLIATLEACGIDTWLLLARPPDSGDGTRDAARDAVLDARLALVADHGGDTLDEAALRARFADLAGAGRPARRCPPPTRLPRVDGAVFRAACRDTLTPTQFTAFDARYVAAVAHARDLIGGLTGVNKTRQLERACKPWLAAAADTDELVLRVRALQIAGLTAGYQVRVDTTALLGAAATLARPGRAGPDRWWEQFDRYRDPDPGAAAAIYSAGGHPANLETITVGDVTFPADLDGMAQATVWTDGTAVTVTGPAVRFLRALVAYRQLCGATGPDRLFVTHRADATRFRQMTRMLAAAEAEVGVSVATAPVRKRQPDADTWLARYGITITKLVYTPVGVATTTAPEEVS